jgi:CHAD domain-containing protein
MGDLLSEISAIPTPAASEHEVKLAAWPGFELPDFDGVIEGVRAGERRVRELDAVYWDTPDLRLIRRGITLRHRSGEGVAKWTLKLPRDPGEAPGLQRDEHDFLQPGDGVPDAVRRLLRAWVRSAPLEPVARIQTVRRSLALVDDEGETVAEVDDDEVSVIDQGRVAVRFREVEVEMIGEERPELLEALLEQLRAAGAGAVGQTPKLVQALGPRAMVPPELETAAFVPAHDEKAAASSKKAAKKAKGPSAGQALVEAAAAAASRVLDNHHVAILDVDPEGVHQARVGIRRLRSLLRVYSPLLDAARADPLDAELHWLAGQYGAVRDLDVQLVRLAAHRVDLDQVDDLVTLRQLVRRLTLQRAEAQAGLAAALDSDRAVVLYDDIVALALDPPFASTDAARPATAVLPPLAQRDWRRLHREVAALDAEPTDEALHKLRVRVKRARYAVEVVMPAVGPPAKGAVRALAALQELLGDHHDAFVAQEWLRGVNADLTPAESYVAGQLVAAERVTSARLRHEFWAAWKQASAKKLWSWLP